MSLTETESEEGTCSLPKRNDPGLLSAMVGSFPAAATFWTTYESSKSALR